jgi:type IV secretion system protein VirD4
MVDSKKATLAVVFFIFILIGWLYAASKIFTLLLYKGQPPFTVMPWTIIEYLQAYGDVKKVRLFLIAAITVPGIVIAGMLYLVFSPKRSSLFGDAKWATSSQLRKNKLLDGEGVILGQYKGQIITAPLQTHILLAAPTGSGKGVAVVLPNLLTWNGSVIVTDIKSENFGYTSKYRQTMGHDVFYFNPGDEDRITHRWNPFSYIGDDEIKRTNELQKIASIFWSPEDDGGDIWNPSARDLFLGLCLFIIETDGTTPTLGRIAREGATLDYKSLKKKIQERQAAGNPFSVACTASLMDFIETSDNTRNSIRKTFTAKFGMFLNPLLDAATAESDFDLRLLRTKRMTIYLGVTPDNLGRLAPLVNLFFQQAVDLHTRVEAKKDQRLKIPLMLMMDEFAVLGKMMQVVNPIAFFRSYNVFLVTIFQSPAQLRAVYGDDVTNGFLENHTQQIAFTPTSMKVAKEIADELGNTTSHSTGKSGQLWDKKSYSENESARALMLPQEIKEMPHDDCLIFSRGLPPIKAKKFKYFKSSVLVDRLKSVSPRLASIGKRLPNQAELETCYAQGEFQIHVPQLAPPVLITLALPEDDRPFRPIEVADLDMLDSIPLADFSVNFDRVELPPPNLTEDELDEYADSVFNQMFAT